jgi:predicted RNA-binding protein with PIN domain
LKHFILDGYNIIKSDASGRLSGGSLEEQRNRLIALLNETHPAGSARNTLTVVFDGPYDSPAAPRYRVGDVKVIFSEGVTADEMIERLVRAALNPAVFVVVTDDRGLHRMLGGLGAVCMAVAEFKQRLFKRSPADESETDAADMRDEITRELEKKWFK